MTGVVVTASMLAPVTDAVTSNLSVILPVGITIMAILLGVTFIPKIVKKFAK